MQSVNESLTRYPKMLNMRLTQKVLPWTLRVGMPKASLTIEMAHILIFHSEPKPKKTALAEVEEPPQDPTTLGSSGCQVHVARRMFDGKADHATRKQLNMWGKQWKV